MVNTTGLVKELKYVKRKYIPIDPIKCEDGDIILGIYLPSVITSPEQSGLGASLLKVKDTTQDTDYYSGNDDDDENKTGDNNTGNYSSIASKRLRHVSP